VALFLGHRAVARGESGAQYPGRRNVPTMSQVLSSIEYICSERP